MRTEADEQANRRPSGDLGVLMGLAMLGSSGGVIGSLAALFDLI